MTRLTEDRFRQEWVAFKADDQKRWTNYSLVQEEQSRELNRQFERPGSRAIATLANAVRSSQRRERAIVRRWFA